MVGGAVRIEELVEPGFRNDVFSAFYPLAVASPAMRAIELERFGVRWCHGPLVLAHPTSDGRCVVLSRDLEETLRRSTRTPRGRRGVARADGLWGRIEPAILRGLATPVPPVRAGVSLLARLGPRGRSSSPGPHCCRCAVSPRSASTAKAQHSSSAATRCTPIAPPESTLGAFFGFVLAALGQTHGYPVPGGRRRCDRRSPRAPRRGARSPYPCATPVERILVEAAGSPAFAPRARRVLRSCSPPSRVGARPVARTGRCRGRAGSGSGEGRLDARRAGPVDGPTRGAPVVHLADSLDALSVYASELARGLEPQRPFMIFGQYASGDPTRAPAGKETAWAYTHGRRMSTRDGVDAWRTRSSASRPDSSALVRGRHVALLPPGRVNGGTAQLHNQFVFRGTRLGPTRDRRRGLFLSSCSAHPGGGVHGAPGWNAARSALRSGGFRRRVAAAGARRSRA